MLGLIATCIMSWGFAWVALRKRTHRVRNLVIMAALVGGAVYAYQYVKASHILKEER